MSKEKEREIDPVLYGGSTPSAHQTLQEVLRFINHEPVPQPSQKQLDANDKFLSQLQIEKNAEEFFSIKRDFNQKLEGVRLLIQKHEDLFSNIAHQTEMDYSLVLTSLKSALELLNSTHQLLITYELFLEKNEEALLQSIGKTLFESEKKRLATLLNSNLQVINAVQTHLHFYQNAQKHN